MNLSNTSIGTFIKVAVAKEFLLPFSSYYAYPFTVEYYIGTADLRGVGGRKNGSWIRESTKMPYNFTAGGALVFHAIVALISCVYYVPSIERAESNIGKRIKRWEFTSSSEGEATCAKTNQRSILPCKLCSNFFASLSLFVMLDLII